MRPLNTTWQIYVFVPIAYAGNVDMINAFRSAYTLTGYATPDEAFMRESDLLYLSADGQQPPTHFAICSNVALDMRPILEQIFASAVGSRYYAVASVGYNSELLGTARVGQLVETDQYSGMPELANVINYDKAWFTLADALADLAATGLKLKIIDDI